MEMVTTMVTGVVIMMVTGTDITIVTGLETIIIIHMMVIHIIMGTGVVLEVPVVSLGISEEVVSRKDMKAKWRSNVTVRPGTRDRILRLHLFAVTAPGNLWAVEMVLVHPQEPGQLHLGTVCAIIQVSGPAMKM